MATYAIGDIQGCYDEFLQLLSEVRFNPENDRLIAVGDLVNRGPDSLKVLRFFYRNRHCVETVLGNHDLYLLARACGLPTVADDDSLMQVLNAADCVQLLSWLRHRPLLLTHHHWLIVHAGIPPQWNKKTAFQLAAEAQQSLRSNHWRTAVLELFSDKSRYRSWQPRLKGFQRLRMIVDSLTRMRVCDSHGRLDLKHNSSALTAADNMQAWFLHRQSLNRQEYIIFGHWAALRGKVDDHRLLALDTGCVWGGEMTLVCLDNLQFFSCKSHSSRGS